MSKLVIYSDGSCDNKLENPSMGIGVVAYYKNTLIDSIGKFVGFGTSNIAEWLGFIEALKIAIEREKQLKPTNIKFCLDSQIVVKQFTGEYKNLKFPKYQREAERLRKQLSCNVVVKWIPRTNNTVADELSKVGNPKLTKTEFKNLK